MTNINELVAQWRAIVKQRSELDRLSRELKNGPETELKAQIMMYLDTHDVPGIRSKIGFITRTKKVHVEIADMQTFLACQLERFQKAQEEGKPLADVLMLQKTAVRSEIDDLVTPSDALALSDDEYNAVAEKFGIRRVSRPDLSFKSAASSSSK